MDGESDSDPSIPIGDVSAILVTPKMEAIEVPDDQFFVQLVVDLIGESSVLTPGEEDVIEYVDPEILKTKFDLSLSSPCSNVTELQAICKDVIQYSVKTNSYKFRNQLFGGTDLYGLGGAFLSEALNTSQYTYEVAPIFTLIEKEVIEQIKNLIGYAKGDGIFCPGGSFANMSAMAIARYRANPLVKTEGMQTGPVLIAFTSEEGHYSMLKAANWLGIGTDNVIKIKCDDFGRMIPEALENEISIAIANGHSPFFVNATVGTTVVGAIDPLEEIWKICQFYGVWCHFDACLGGSLLFSSTHKEKIAIAAKTNSFTWNPHKMLGAPLQCSVLMTSYHRDILHECNSAKADYLFQPNKYYDTSYDTGDKTVQCGRKVDAFKLWLMWKARGVAGFESLVDNAFECARIFKAKIQDHPNFELVQSEFDMPVICFWYIPNKLLEKPRTEEWWNEIYQIPPFVKECLVRAGTLLIGYAPLPTRDKGNCFRMVVPCHPTPTPEHMDYVIERILEFGEFV